jgi:hypothetical protein
MKVDRSGNCFSLLDISVFGDGTAVGKHEVSLHIKTEATKPVAL